MTEHLSDTECCKTCRCYRDPFGFVVEGHCHRHAPTVIHPTKQHCGIGGESVWPIVPANSWCGDWEPSFIGTQTSD